MTPSQAALIAAEYGELLAAARASVAAAELGEPDPLVYVRAVLEEHGQLPQHGARPSQVLAQPLPTDHFRSMTLEKTP